MWKSLKERVSITWKDWTKKDLIMWLFITFLFVYFFYRNLQGLVVAVPAAYLYIKIEKRSQRVGDVRNEVDQFRECLHSVAASLRAGYAPAGAFLESRRDMFVMYGEHSEIVKRLDALQIGLRNNQSIEELLLCWGNSGAAEEIAEFAEVFAIAKKSGGSLVGVIESTVLMIMNRMDAQREMETLLANRRLEQRIMSAMPFLILLYLQIGNPGYFNVLYHNAGGVLIMTIMLLVFLWSQYYFSKVLEEVFA